MTKTKKESDQKCPIPGCKKNATFDDETGEWLCEEHTEELHDEIDQATEEVIDNYLDHEEKVNEWPRLPFLEWFSPPSRARGSSSEPWNANDKEVIKMDHVLFLKLEEINSRVNNCEIMLAKLVQDKEKEQEGKKKWLHYNNSQRSKPSRKKASRSTQKKL